MKLLPLAAYILANFLYSLQKAETTENAIFPNILRDSSKPLPLVILQCLNKQPEHFIMIDNFNRENKAFFKPITTPIYLFDVKHNIFKKLKRFQYFAITNETIAKKKVYPISSFLIRGVSRTTLTSLLSDLRESIWWNKQAHFLIYNNDDLSGCKLARQYLYVAWNFNILSAIYLCRNEQDKLSAYTFNPYDRVGSAFWKIVPDENKEKDYWTLLFHLFEDSTHQEDMSLRCSDLSLDKTTNLNHLNVRIGSNKFDKVPVYGHKIEVYDDMKIIGILLKTLNATYTHKLFSEFGLVTPAGPTSFLKEIESSSMNIVTVCNVMHYDWRIQTYPHQFDKFRIVTAKETVIIFRVIVTSTIILIPLFTYLSSMIFFRLSLQKSIAESFLETLRIHTNTPILARCFVSAHSTVPKYEVAINSIEDLLNSKLPLCATIHVKEMIYPEELLEQFVPVDKATKCVRELSSGRKIACAIHRVDLAFENTDNVHVAKFSLAAGPAAFVVSPDWPLLSKFNHLLNIFFESGIYQEFSVHSSALKFVKGIKKDYKYGSVTMFRLTSRFGIFLGGCSVAFCVLLIELSVHRFLNSGYLCRRNMNFDLLLRMWNPRN